MEYPTLAVYEQNNWGSVFETSSIREHNECLLVVDYACHEDDTRFLDGPEKNNARVEWVFEMVDWGYEDDESMDALVELLEGKEEDMWLWVDGDEKYLGSRYTLRFGLPKYGRSAAIQALRGRQVMPRWESSRDAETRRRVQTESPVVRIAAITWLIILSKTMNRRDHDCGSSDSTTWDLQKTIRDWVNRLDVLNVFDDLPVVSASHLEDFEATMVIYGHNCHKMRILTEHSLLARWLYVQNVLFGECGVVNLTANYTAECKACFDYTKIYRPPDQHLSYERSNYSVLLALWGSIAFNYNRRTHLIEWLSGLLCSYPHLFAAGKLLAKTFIENLPCDPPLVDYLPWANAYPQDWRWYLTMYSSQTWKIIDTLSNQATLADTEPDLMEWFLAILFTLSQAASAHIIEPTSKCGQIQYFYRLVEKITPYVFIARKKLNLNEIKAPATSVVENFRRSVESSTHTCWDEYDPGWYAAAVAYLYDREEIEFLPLLRPHCNQCAFTCAARTFADRISESSSLSSSKDAQEDLLWTMTDRYRESGDIAQLRSMLDDDSSSVANRNEDLCTPEVSAPYNQPEDIPTNATLSAVEARDFPTEDRLPLNVRLDTVQAPAPKLKHDDMLDEVKNYLINALLKEGAYLNLNKGEFTLPWSQLRSKLVEWDIEMVNWPEKVPLKDKKKGINGLNSHSVQLLYRAIRNKERPLHFRRITQATAGESQKRTAEDRDDSKEGPPAKRLYISG